MTSSRKSRSSKATKKATKKKRVAPKHTAASSKASRKPKPAGGPSSGGTLDAAPATTAHGSDGLIALAKDLRPVELPLDSIFLDPNNPRFVGRDWIRVPLENVCDPATQAEASRRLFEAFGVAKLRLNMEVNGYLPIDRVVVKELAGKQYVVLEGNRRVCAAKLIAQAAASGTRYDSDVIDSLKSIPCLEYVGTEKDASWVFQGLRHITGISDWSAFNKARLLVEQMDNEDLSLGEVGRRFGLTSHGAGQWVRGYHAFTQASEESDFVSEIDELSYPYFQELFSRSSAPVREWLEWNEAEMRCDSGLNLNEFVSWLYPRPLDEEDEESADAFGNWERRALRRRDDIRQVAVLLRDDTEMFEKFRREQDIEKAYAEAMTRKFENNALQARDAQREVFRALDRCTKALDEIPHKLLKDTDLRAKLDERIEKLEAAIASTRE